MGKKFEIFIKVSPAMYQKNTTDLKDIYINIDKEINSFFNLSHLIYGIMTGLLVSFAHSKGYAG